MMTILVLLQKLIFQLFAWYRKIDYNDCLVWQDLNLFEKIKLLISKKEKLWSGHNEAKRFKNYTFPLRSLQQKMSIVLTKEEMLRVLISELENTTITNCYITMLVPGAKRRGIYSTVYEESELVLSYENGRLLSDPNFNHFLKFKTLNLLPKKMLNKTSGNSWFVSPIFNRTHIFGFIVSDCKEYSGAMFESIRHQLSVTLERCYINDQRLEAEAKLLDIMDDLEKHNLQLKKDSMYDEMTSLLNRRGFIREVKSKISTNSSNKIQFCLFFADMDGLKKINDTFGHASGDMAITDMSLILKEIFREEDTIARLGGDEFTIFTISVPDNFPEIVHRRLTKLLKEYNFNNKDSKEKEFILSISIGHIMSYTNDQTIDLSNLMEQADHILYEHKRKKKEISSDY
jgi:diguanylate cyclase (GGDEF)-like protein